MTLGSGFAASRRVAGKLYGFEGSRDGGYFGSAAGPRGAGVLVAKDDIETMLKVIVRIGITCKQGWSRYCG